MPESQGELFDDGIEQCLRGNHAELRDDEPIIGDLFVNVDHRCPRCGLCLSSTSWTRVAWDLKHAKEATR